MQPLPAVAGADEDFGFVEELHGRNFSRMKQGSGSVPCRYVRWCYLACKGAAGAAADLGFEAKLAQNVQRGGVIDVNAGADEADTGQAESIRQKRPDRFGAVAAAPSRQRQA